MRCATRETSSAVWRWFGRVGVGAPFQDDKGLTDKGSPVDVPRGVRPPRPGGPPRLPAGRTAGVPRVGYQTCRLQARCWCPVAEWCLVVV